jgi:hypothetical protein
MAKLPEHITISPMTLRCPHCNAEPGEVCEVLPNEGLEIVHVERIEVALALDVAAKAQREKAARHR